MKTILVRIPEGKVRWFNALFDQLKVEHQTIEPHDMKGLNDLFEVNDDGDPKEQVLANVKAGLEQIKAIKSGKMKGRPASELLNEL